MKKERAKQLLQNWWKPVLVGFLSGAAKAVGFLLFSHLLR
jgi:hypothetical protein